ncbi:MULTISPECIES: T9SS type A sorting domain-containing protein [Bizionia]|uniref:T9SS type A sorting domain-containing protein n=1 Tax=Bizionia algoritergicola TaxID=291187 RepID=A0A5D0R258_9FLAO|nr:MULTISPECIES: T9SS type A sorting domain-containing protein [Bizionia]OBX23126.1 hypothetical protein BAA08_06225 [Bizionia sp. APA-3]TYB74788.1 T9SS type A sorting domain-containing protein [Bizionia algoritergicola]
MKKITYLLAIFIASFLQLQAQIVVNPVSATTTFVADYGTDVVNTYNGSGLETPASLTSNHVATDGANSFVATTVTGTIDFDLGNTYDVVGLSFWNQNGGGPDPQVGVNAVNFYYSLDNITYTLIPGAPTAFAQVLTNIAGPETATFATVSAAYIRMEVLTNHGEVQTGFAEIAFSSTGPTLSVERANATVFSIYPNPAQGSVNVSSNLEQATQLGIYDITGKLVLSNTISFGNNRLNISSLSSGVYLMRVSTSTKTVTKKLVVN